MGGSYRNTASYTEASVQSVFPHLDVLKWTTKPNATMVKYLVDKCYANGAAVMTALCSDKHRMIGDLMLAKLYPMVSVTPFEAPTAPMLTITPTETYPQLAL